MTAQTPRTQTRLFPCYPKVPSVRQSGEDDNVDRAGQPLASIEMNGYRCPWRSVDIYWRPDKSPREIPIRLDWALGRDVHNDTCSWQITIARMSMDILAYAWVPMNIHKCVRISMDINEHCWCVSHYQAKKLVSRIFQPRNVVRSPREAIPSFYNYSFSSRTWLFLN